MVFFNNGTYLTYFWYVTAKESIEKLDPVGSTVCYEVMKLKPYPLNGKYFCPKKKT